MTRPLLALCLLASVAAARPLPDRDADGLPDAWETGGVLMRSKAGARWIDLPSMGADPDRPDVFLHVDWMADAEHDHRPHPEALELVVDAFANAPVVCPTGAVGIALHIDAGPDSVLDASGRRWGPLSRARVLPWQRNLGSAAGESYDWTAFGALRNAPGGFADSGRAAIFHYAVFGHYHDLDGRYGAGASGISRGIGGTELLVTLGNFTDGVGNAREQAGTLMHELGHNLGLRHGGCDDTNLKPGYASVMNYAFQAEGLVRGGMRGIIDYARGPLPSLDRALLPEPLGLLSNAAVEAAGRARSCVVPGESRAGVKHVVPAASAPVPSECGDGAAIDDWNRVRLRAAGIGDPKATARR
jgi:hypothetical protein